jgi:hypothetical protein
MVERREDRMKFGRGRRGGKLSPAGPVRGRRRRTANDQHRQRGESGRAPSRAGQKGKSTTY